MNNRAQMKESLLLHEDNVRKQYPDKGFESNTVNFWNTINDERQTFSSVCKVDKNLLYAASSTENDIVVVIPSLDRVSMRGSIQRVFFMACIGEQYPPFVMYCFWKDVCYHISWNRNDWLANAVKGSDIIFSDPANHKIYKFII